MSYKLGSLFDGSGGFPLAGYMCGVEPKWASEVEPYPIAVTRSRFPNMRHLGDISKVNGGEIEPVDIVTFGSPCTDMSVAGLRAGLDGKQSVLFYQAVRIIKEMRQATNGKHPTFALWENVPGAFSSNKGEDFRTVLEELIRIIEPSAVMPEVPKAGWAYADSYTGDGWSLAYRVFDAQHWGVPQRRRRIHLVIDFRGERAREVLFEREGVRGYFAEGRTPWQATTADAQRCLGADDRERGINPRSASDSNIAATLYAAYGTKWNGNSGAYNGENFVLEPIAAATQQGGIAVVETKLMDAYQHHGWRENTVCGTLTAGQNDTVRGDTPLVCVPHTLKIRSDCEGGGNVPMVMEQKMVEPTPVYCLQGNGIDRADTAGCNGKGVKEDTSYTLNTIDRHAVAYAMQGFGDYKQSDVSSGMKARDYKDATDLVAQPIALDRVFFNQGQNALYDPQFYQDGTVPTLIARGPAAVQIRYIVRRLTPTECARLQGFPDKWGHFDEKDSFTPEEYRFWLDVRNTHAAINGKPEKEYTEAQMLTWYNKLHTDSAEYKMWGNGIALPPALYCMQGMVDALNSKKEDADE